MLGTAQDKTSQENIEITEYMEEKVLELAREKSFLGIFTTNSSPLTQVSSSYVILCCLKNARD